MRSAVADALREERLCDTLALSVEERIELALKLGRRDVDFYMAVNRVDRDTALRHLRDVSSIGRNFVRSDDEL